MSRIVIALGALLAGLIVVPATPQVASADSGCPTAAVSYAGGTGTSGDPRLISTPEQLQRLRDDSVSGWDKSYLITADIDMGGCTWSRGIGTDARNFTGRLDGGGHVISGLDVSRVGSTELFVYAGLVTILGASGVVTRVGFTGDVTAIHSGTGDRIATAGGLVGFAYTNATISFSYTTGDASAQGTSSTGGFGFARAGGLVGWTDGAVIRDSYATGSASSVGSMGAISGGLVGLSTIGSITRGYSTGASTGTAPSNLSIGGFVGDVSSTLTGNLWDTTSSGTSAAAGSGTSTGIAGKTGSQMRQFSTYNDSTWPIVNGWQPFDSAANKVWGICNGSTRAFLLWQYSANPCAAAPGVATITSVTPDQTSAQIAFTVDDTGGSPLTWIEVALDDTSAVDDSTGTTSSPYVLTGLRPSTFYTVFLRAVNPQSPGPWSAASSFTTLAPPPPIPASPPQAVTAVPGDASVEATWTPPAAPGSFPVSTYQATASPGGQSCLSSTTTCTIEGLTNGVTYTVTVTALTGAGWSPSSAPSNAVTPRRAVRPTLTITGSRGRDRAVVRVNGSSTGLPGERATMWLALNGQEAKPGATTAPIKADGTFTWSRRTSREVRLYAEVGSTRSNTITISAR